jgi:hypothetical protein
VHQETNLAAFTWGDAHLPLGKLAVRLVLRKIEETINIVHLPFVRRGADLSWADKLPVHRPPARIHSQCYVKRFGGHAVISELHSPHDHGVFYNQPVCSDHIEIADLCAAHRLEGKPPAVHTLVGPVINCHATKRQGIIDGPARSRVVAIELTARQEVHPNKIWRAGGHLVEVMQRRHLRKQAAIQPAGS